MELCLTVTRIDWSLTRDVVATFATVAALGIGLAGLFTWRRQLRGTSEYEVAKRILVHAYQIQDAIRSVRNPMLHLSKEEVEAGRKLEEEQRVYAERMSAVYEKWAELKVLMLEAKAIWGESAERPFRPLEQRIRELRSALWLHFWMKGAYSGPGTTVDDSAERVEKNDKIVYEVSEDDEFARSIADAVLNIEEYFGSKVRE